MDNLTVVDPPQYSVAWVILAVLCLIVAVAAVVLAVRLTRARVEKLAWRRKPSDIDALKAEFLMEIGDVEAAVSAGQIDESTAHRDLETILRTFAIRTQGVSARNASLITLQADPRTAQIGSLIARFHEPSFARTSRPQISQSLHDASEVIRSWS